MTRRSLVFGALVAAAFSAGTAHAYPQWQFSSGTSRCGQCHYAPAGGGLINGYGRDAVGEELSSFEGDGSFLHGVVALPRALALGFDARYAVLNHDVEEARGSKTALFPMQADLSGRYGFAEAFSAHATVGYRGRVRGGAEPVGAGGASPAGGSAFVSREHYLMWRPEALGLYARAGRFFAPFGLRLAEHHTYVRRDLGFNLLEETYNLSGGFVAADQEIHATLFMPDLLRDIGGDEAGVVVMGERRLGEASAIGLQTRLGVKPDQKRATAGAFGKIYFEHLKLLVQSELDLTHASFSGASEQSFAGYLGVTYFPLRGLWVTPFVERSQTAIRLRGSSTHAFGAQLQWFPYPHFEVTLLGRAQQPRATRSEPTRTARTGLLLLHYYL